MQRNPLNGRPEPEVIVNFVDGLSFNKGKMEAAIFGGDLFPSKPPTKAQKDTFIAKKEDVDLIVRELEIPRVQAERAFGESKGDLERALINLITPSAKTTK
ncbi:uncharacterized protein FOMMEDRAFT_109392 [Fomitiporia mediterranea MF3/22]|uniref:uncharacterized protein n=1 Tax=Fomitiporia mediterranea (strain MF3/22) TaxID=694068 RepID=UPI000440995D|nr:uncharacterized protein FOMMEDRAFT_109392 [Fomitiporia mediterranea MF3/22]EJD02190.1 hypothetical protein FOMMEDRAFT_109392 [Fomitiporia mediterranea MF3/22]